MIYRFFNTILYAFMSYFLGTIFLYKEFPILTMAISEPHLAYDLTLH